MWHIIVFFFNNYFDILIVGLEKVKFSPKQTEFYYFFYYNIKAIYLALFDQNTIIGCFLKKIATLISI